MFKLSKYFILLCLVLSFIVKFDLNAYESEYRGTKFLSMKKPNSYWDCEHDKLVRPTKKDLRLAKDLYDSLKVLKPKRKYIARVTNSRYKRLRRTINTMNFKYFKYFEPVYSLETGLGYVKVEFKGKRIKEAISENKRVEKKLKRVIKEIGLSKSVTEYEAVILIDNYLCSNLEYLYNEREYDRLQKKHKYNLYWSLDSGLGICQDYAYCFDLIASEVGLKAGIVFDSTINHAYNVVYVDNKLYYLDSCWNDCSRSKDFLFMTEFSDVPHDFVGSYVVW